MDKQLHELTKPKLISIIQDYQEMVSEIEEELNTNLDASEKGFEKLRLTIRSILDKHL
jgi:hypothetical protein